MPISPASALIIHRGSLPFIILLAATIRLSGAVNIKGHVRDRASEAPVIGANVLVKGTDEGSATDTQGNFQFRTAAT
ncbi:MAG: carboxypeptidase-like regulatory domain-containing protein, partial [Candidatus Marinimicrobia bacterium]|nr:carboxypeptidase-like regulatory domain-containing protein [Candidatus Neomarinimicrobiota bacterium]